MIRYVLAAIVGGIIGRTLAMSSLSSPPSALLTLDPLDTDMDDSLASTPPSSDKQNRSFAENKMRLSESPDPSIEPGSSSSRPGKATDKRSGSTSSPH